MRSKLEDIIVKYSHSDSEFSSLKIDEGHFMELLKKYLNDKNSSTLRQDIMCVVAGLISNPKKLGYDGESSTDEMKPKNVDTTNPKFKRLDGRGNYKHKRRVLSLQEIRRKIQQIVQIPSNDLEFHAFLK